MVDRIEILTSLRLAEDINDEAKTVAHLNGSLPIQLGRKYHATLEESPAAFRDFQYSLFELSARFRFRNACDRRKLAITSDKLYQASPAS